MIRVIPFQDFVVWIKFWSSFIIHVHDDTGNHIWGLNCVNVHSDTSPPFISFFYRVYHRIYVGFLDHSKKNLVWFLPAFLSYYSLGHKWVRTRFCWWNHQYKSRRFPQLDSILSGRKTRKSQLSRFCVYETGTQKNENCSMFYYWRFIMHGCNNV